MGNLAASDMALNVIGGLGATVAAIALGTWLVRRHVRRLGADGPRDIRAG